MPSKRILQKEKKRAAIIDAAEHLFFSKGYERTTMDDLCHEAHFSKRTLYMYFNSKEQIHFEIMIRGYKQLISMLDQESHLSNIIERLKQMTGTFYQFSVDFPEYFAAIFSYENNADDFQKGVPDSSKEECYALGEVVFHRLAILIQEGQEEGVFRSDLDSKHTALILWSCMNGVLNTAKLKTNYLANYHYLSPKTLIDNAFDLIIHSICKNHGGALK
ncbi:TetR/AcrR family transcriptional regulator [Sporolactobacillus shoreicorticis]|uniref:TetR/AcrR family transcriptional regulator n=1 Tax=Sporolactobacillus shoreicorticis TaxID=1923877 RepID=A0ABW5S1N4_9BACL|nr:TetR/AcrR family transcriptional regulator [Sporolactobacillus shoreicorticis]MCO7125299.1 TetR/AcrR family transcriptional regulator [Sporolactobacillus shoreicorticis]